MTAVEWTPEQRALVARVAGDGPPVGTKRCGRCGQVKPTAEFFRNRSRSDGLQHACIPCQNARTRMRSRASTSARTRLVQIHKAEYRALYAEELAKLRADD